MLTLNILHLIKNQIIPIKYSINLNYNNKYFYLNLNKNIFEILNLLNSLSIVYLFLYKYISLKQKILFTTNYDQYMYLLKSIATISSNYHIYNTTYSEIFSNWIFLKKKLIIYKWLKYFFLTNLAIKNNYKNIFSIYYILYLLYLKLKLKYHGLRNLNIFPNTLIIIILYNNTYLKKILKFKKNIILINNIKNNKYISNNIINLNTNINFNTIFFIITIINTAIFHGMLY
uniref:Ribosomal protein S2 n=1 Tax=Cyclospora cayetanensis TaxID=88456 RepID=A0A0K0NUM9_9EIME|nr:ribosomal protein S2 [Cyclospora cayetanensis]AKO71994.1 ribosomal protein S2 [Cyclospora cayetanensis]